MRNLVFLICVAIIPSLLFCGCTSNSNSTSELQVTGRPFGAAPYSVICIDGVEYIRTYYKLAPHFLADEEGRPYLVKCENE